MQRYYREIIAEGTPNELKQKYMTRYVQGIEIDKVVEALEVMYNKDGSRHFEVSSMQ
jgi:hypothetical protein